MTAPMVIAIDGPSAAGKGTLARRLAAHYGLPYLDTGLLYRAVGRLVLVAGGNPADPEAALAAARRLAPADLDRADLRGPDADEAASLVAAQPAVRAQLLDFQRRFGDGRGAVLVGSQSFWEGIDVPGDALQCVIIDKLPFPPPGDPLVEARVRQLRAQGRNPFDDYFVAEAAVALKQGAGRLIRSESDSGLLVVCDPRMRTMP